MEFANLHMFRAAAEEENFTRAAKRLNCSQAYLSQVIKKFESDIGVPLFDRSGRKVTLNIYGKRLLKASAICDNAMENVRREIKNALSEERQAVRLVVRCPLGDLPAVIKDFREQNPNIEITTITPGDDKIAEGYDLELLASNRELEEENALCLCNDPYVLIAASSSFLAARKSISLKELSDVGFVSSPLSTEMTRMQAQLFKEAGFAPNIRCYSSSYWTLLSLVEQSVGVCVGCEQSWLAKTTLEVKAIPFSDVNVARKLYLRWPQGSFLTDASLELIDYLEEVFQDEEGRA